MDSLRLEVGALLQRTWTVISAAPVGVIAYIIALSAVGVFADLTVADSPGYYFLNSIVGFVAGYFLLRHMLGRSGLLREGQGGGFGAYFGVSLLAGFGTLLGFILLIVPGLVLMVRWQAAVALVLCEDEDASDALGKSWEMTRASFWSILAVLLIGIVPTLLLVVGLGAGIGFAGLAGEELTASYAELIAGNVLANAYSVFATALPAAVYWMLRREGKDVSEVFA